LLLRRRGRVAVVRLHASRFELLRFPPVQRVGRPAAALRASWGTAPLFTNSASALSKLCAVSWLPSPCNSSENFSVSDMVISIGSAGKAPTGRPVPCSAACRHEKKPGRNAMFRPGLSVRPPSGGRRLAGGVLKKTPPLAAGCVSRETFSRRRNARLAETAAMMTPDWSVAGRDQRRRHRDWCALPAQPFNVGDDLFDVPTRERLGYGADGSAEPRGIC